jgi:6-pyruvoyltetrahydropterin/6-carboxytetrahydropterin synthase
MKYTVTKEFRFEAAHSLPHLPNTHKCHGVHGHSYKVVVACSKCQLDARGFVIDYAEISKATDPLVAKLDHPGRLLEDIINMKSTAENLGAWFFYKLKLKIPCLVYVEVYETPKTCCRVEPLPTQ